MQPVQEVRTLRPRVQDSRVYHTKMKGNSRAQKKDHRNRGDNKLRYLFVTSVTSQAITPKIASPEDRQGGSG